MSVHLKGTYCVTPAGLQPHEGARPGRRRSSTRRRPRASNGNFGQTQLRRGEGGHLRASRAASRSRARSTASASTSLAPVALTRLTEDLPGFAGREDEGRAWIPTLVVAARRLPRERPREGRDRTRRSSSAAGSIAEMRMVTRQGRDQDGRTAASGRPRRSRRRCGDILLPSSRRRPGTRAERVRPGALPRRAAAPSGVDCAPCERLTPPAASARRRPRRDARDPLSAMTPRFNLFFRWFARRFFGALRPRRRDRRAPARARGARHASST